MVDIAWVFDLRVTADFLAGFSRDSLRKKLRISHPSARCPGRNGPAAGIDRVLIQTGSNGVSLPAVVALSTHHNQQL